MPSHRRVYIVEHSPEVLELLQTIVRGDPGCDVQGSLAGLDNFEYIREYQPDLVILDFVFGRGEDWRLIDRLRTDEATRPVPVLALSTTEVVAEDSLASFNVRETLGKPFEMQRLVEVVRTLLSQPRISVPAAAPRPGTEALWEASTLLVENARQIVDEMPLLLWGTAVALRLEEPDRLFVERGPFRQAAINHAQQQRQSGVGLDVLLSEYQLLRDVIWQTLDEKAGQTIWVCGDAFRMGRVVNRTLDGIIAIAVEAHGRGPAGVGQ